MNLQRDWTKFIIIHKLRLAKTIPCHKPIIAEWNRSKIPRKNTILVEWSPHQTQTQNRRPFHDKSMAKLYHLWYPNNFKFIVFVVYICFEKPNTLDLVFSLTSKDPDLILSLCLVLKLTRSLLNLTLLIRIEWSRLGLYLDLEHLSQVLTRTLCILDQLLGL